MTKLDTFGAPVSSQNQASIDAFNEAATLLLGFREDPLEKIDAALAADPDFVMGHCFRAGLFLISSEAAGEPELKDALATLRRLSDKANDRERQHIAAIAAWSDREFHVASDIYGQLLFEYPRDIVALQFAHQTDFLLGQQNMLRDRLQHVLPSWSEDDPGYGYLLGMQAFGLEETGQYARAEEAGKRAVMLNPYDAWAYHAVAHVYEMQGRTEEGIYWLTGSAENWSPRNMLAFHNWWHLGLFHLENNEIATARCLYDHAIRPKPSDLAMEMADGAAMLWRFHLRGAEVGNRWTELADIYESRAEDAYYPFNDAHAMMSFVATGRDKAARRTIAALEAAAGDDNSSSRIIRDVGLPVARAIRAFGETDYESCFDTLLDVRKRAVAFGGSNAQRDVLNLTMIEAAIRAGNKPAATALVNERRAEKEESPLAECLLKRISGEKKPANGVHRAA
jgi:tetratricopeptide (TPR) repeat protein